MLEVIFVKKIIAILMTFALLVSASACFAEATDKPIAFAEFSFGDTFENIRSNMFIRSAEFKRVAYTPRALADAFNFIVEWNGGNSMSPVCFVATPDEGREVAGYRCELKMWFAYPAGDGQSVQEEKAAKMYAGEYYFHETIDGMFDDLKGKLTQVYGEPDAVTNDLTEALGEMQISEDMKNSYNEEIARYAPTYAVWKSTANNTAVVLKTYKEGGDWERVKISYLDLNAELVQPVGGAVANNSLEGL